jgi:hypothetical protein
MSQPILEIALEEASIRPDILAITARFTILIGSVIAISICELLCSFTMLQTRFELSLISIAVDPGMYTVSIGFAEFPFTNV